MSIAALVLGIVSLVMSCFGFLLGPLAIVSLVMGITGIVLAAVAKHKQGKGTAGLVLSILSTVFSFVPGILWILAICAAAGL